MALRANASLASLAQYVRAQERRAWANYSRSRDHAKGHILDAYDRMRMEHQERTWHDAKLIADHLERLAGTTNTNPDKE